MISIKELVNKKITKRKSFNELTIDMKSNLPLSQNYIILNNRLDILNRKRIKLTIEYESIMDLLTKIDNNKPKISLLGIIFFPIFILNSYSYEKKNKSEREKLYSLKEQISSDLELIRIEEKEINRKLIYERYIINISTLRSKYEIKIGNELNLYYIRLSYDNKLYYKIGITKNSVKYRFMDQNGLLYKKIDKIFFDLPIVNAKIIEKSILMNFKDKLAKDKNILKSYGGYTEVFLEDILNLDTK